MVEFDNVDWLKAIDRIIPIVPDEGRLVDPRYDPFLYEDGRRQFQDGIPADRRVNDPDEFSADNVPQWIEHYLFVFDEKLDRIVWERLTTKFWVDYTLAALGDLKMKCQRRISDRKAQNPDFYRQFGRGRHMPMGTADREEADWRRRMTRLDNQVSSRINKIRAEKKNHNRVSTNAVDYARARVRDLATAVRDLLAEPDSPEAREFAEWALDRRLMWDDETSIRDATEMTNRDDQRERFEKKWGWHGSRAQKNGDR